MGNLDVLKIELNKLTVYQLRNLQYAITKKLQEKTSEKIDATAEILTDEELDMLLEIMKS